MHDDCGLNLWRLALGGSFFPSFGVPVSSTPWSIMEASGAIVLPEILAIVDLATVLGTELFQKIGPERLS